MIACAGLTLITATPVIGRGIRRNRREDGASGTLAHSTGTRALRASAHAAVKPSECCGRATAGFLGRADHLGKGRTEKPVGFG